MLALKKPSLKYRDTYLMAISEYHSEGFLVGKINYLEVKNDFRRYINNIEDWSKGLNLPKGFCHQSEFWLIDSEGYIGTLKIRHSLCNDIISNVGGHIGYFIRPSKRNLGYGNIILKLGLIEAKKLGINDVLITCDKDNIPSQKIIEANGGVFERLIENYPGEDRCRYWINL